MLCFIPSDLHAIFLSRLYKLLLCQCEGVWMIWLSQIPHISNTNQKKIETQLCLHSRVLYYRFYLTLFASVGEVLKIHICGIYHFVLVIPFRKTHWKELHTDIFFLMHIYMFLWDIVIFQMSKIQLAYSLVAIPVLHSSVSMFNRKQAGPEVTFYIPFCFLNSVLEDRNPSKWMFVSNRTSDCSIWLAV